jgi:hypothetical protein
MEEKDLQPEKHEEISEESQDLSLEGKQEENSEKTEEPDPSAKNVTEETNSEEGATVEATDTPEEQPAQQEKVPSEDPVSKEAIIAHLDQFAHLEPDELVKNQGEVESLEEKFQSVVEKQQAEEKRVFRKELEEGKIDNPTAVYEYKKDEFDHRFAELLNLISDKVEKRKAEDKAHRESIRQERQDLLVELKKLIDEEDRIGKAFQRFEQIRTRWRELSEASTRDHGELQREYGQLLDQFFYNIQIYKDLRDLDLQKNQEQKEDVIRRISNLKEEQSIHQIELLIRALQDEWNEIGPTFQHAWEDLKNRYWSEVKEVYDRVRDHYAEVRKQHEENKRAKELLIEKVEEQNKKELNSAKAWNKATDTVIATQGAWKRVGYIKKDENEKLWETFRSACDQFFDKKSEYFERLKKEQDKYKNRKQQLVDKAVALKESKDWRHTAEQLKNLQKQWKEIPPARQKDERQLWQEFRAACDHFFESRKAYFDSLDDRLEEGKRASEELLQKAKDWKPAGDAKAAMEELGDFIKEWYAIEFKPKETTKKLNQDFQSTVDKHLAELNIDEIEKALLRYKSKIEGLSNSDRAKDLLKKELDRIRADIDKKKDELIQYENNLDFFGESKGVEALRKEVEHKMDQIRHQVERLKEYRKVVENKVREI